MEGKNKSFAFSRFADMITRSWTYHRMTESEKTNWFRLVEEEQKQGHIFGTFDQRFKIMHGLYHAYLIGIGYNNETNWREPDPDSVPKF